MTKSLKEKAISIKGKKYVLVSDRVLFFNENFPNGKIETRLLSETQATMVVIKAKITPDVNEPKRCFFGHSQAKWGQGLVNETAALENAETSAVGRGLAMLGIGVLESIASADEMNKSMAKTPENPINEFKNSICPKCKAPIAISHRGKPYCSAKCWLKKEGQQLMV